MTVTDFTPNEMMTIAAARQLGNDDVCFVGIGAPSAACNVARLTHAPSDQLAISLGLGVADFQEATFTATAWRADLGVTWAPKGSPLELSAAVVRDGFWGDTAAPADTRAQLGLTWRFGDTGGTRRPVADRAFHAAQPMDGLIRRGLF